MKKTVTLALAAALALPLAPLPAAATDWDWSMGSGTPTSRAKKARVKYAKRYNKSSTASASNDATKVMAYVKREDVASKQEVTCADKVRGLGTQWIGTEGAMDAAKKDWMERVRYDYGESYLDMTNSKDFVSRCGRVSIGETMGQVMYRCEIVARPCKGLMADTKAASK
jgi:hypothetical protein